MTKQQLIKEIENDISTEDKISSDWKLIQWSELVSLLDLTLFNVNFKNNVLTVKHKAFSKKVKIRLTSVFLLNEESFNIDEINSILCSLLILDK